MAQLQSFVFGCCRSTSAGSRKILCIILGLSVAQASLSHSNALSWPFENNSNSTEPNILVAAELVIIERSTVPA